MNQVREKLFSCLESLKKKTDFKPEVALVLGSGLGDYAEHIEVCQRGKIGVLLLGHGYDVIVHQGL